MPHPHRPLSHTALRSDNTLHVIVAISNPVRYHSRYRLYEQFQRHILQQPQVNLVTVELAFGDRKHEVTDKLDRSHHLRLRTHHELWHKENLLNLGVRMLPVDWKYVAWIDGDVTFVNPEVAQETLHQLQHHPVVQMFETAVDLGPTSNALAIHQGFGAQLVSGAERVLNIGSKDYYGGFSSVQQRKAAFWHPGFAWACTRKFYENVGGLLDIGIMGAGDHHMALGLIGQAAASLPPGLHPNYAKKVSEWQAKALRAANQDVGVVSGTLMHHWHGPKKRRYYIERWDVLKKSQYDPEADVAYDQNGVLYLSNPSKIQLRDDLRRYFRARNEDSFDEE